MPPNRSSTQHRRAEASLRELNLICRHREVNLRRLWADREASGSLHEIATVDRRSLPCGVSSIEPHAPRLRVLEPDLLSRGVWLSRHLTDARSEPFASGPSPLDRRIIGKPVSTGSAGNDGSAQRWQRVRPAGVSRGSDLRSPSRSISPLPGRSANVPDKG